VSLVDGTPVTRVFILVTPEAPGIRPYIVADAIDFWAESWTGGRDVRAVSREELLEAPGGPHALMDWLNRDTSQVEADDAWGLAESEAEDLRLRAMTPLERELWARGQEGGLSSR
jgi:hypothetical protein